MADEPRKSSSYGPEPLRSALRIGFLYLLFGAAWILVSDTVLAFLVEDTARGQTYKGLAFVLASAVVIMLLVRRELAARRGAERERERSDRRYRALFHRGVAGIFRTTLDGEILEANRALARMLAFDEPSELLGRNSRDFYADPEQRETWIDELRAEGEVRNFELHLLRRDGYDLWALMNASLLELDDGDEPVLAGTMVDVTERKRLRDELEAYAYQDALTGLPNRRYLKEQAEAVLSKAARDEATVGFLYLDLDRFKRVNDTLGHEVGDEVLFQVGRRMLRHLREEDTAARIGGDEFAVVLNTIADREGAMEAARRLHDALADPFYAGGHSIYVAPSLGVSLYPDHGDGFSELLSCADRAMYQAFEKTEGIRLYEPVAHRARRDQIAEEADLREALREGQLELLYQPVCRVEDGATVGAEALTRWRHPGIGLRGPGAFIPVAEHTGLIRDIDRWAFETVLRDLPTLVGKGDLEWLAMNVSALSLNDPDTVGRFYELLEEADLTDGTLVVEITESTAMRDPRASADLFRELQRRGVRVAIDDFGTGHSALAYLKSLPVDMVKLDMIFVRGIEASEQEDRLLAALIGLGRTLAVEVVAEGVETAGQLERVEAHCCHLAQGYHLGRPMSLATLRERL